MVILGMLAALVAPKFFGRSGKETVSVKTQIELLGQALIPSGLDTGSILRQERDWKRFSLILVLILGRPYLKKAIPNDPWSRPYHYESPGNHGDYDLYSLGADAHPAVKGKQGH